MFKALRNYVNDPRNVGLHVERLDSLARGLWSIRIDDDYRIILRRFESNLGESDTLPPAFLFVGKHDIAYRFAERTLLGKSPDVGINFVDSVIPLSGVATSKDLQPKKNAVPINLDDLSSLIKTRKYLPIARMLLQQEQGIANFSFNQIEEIIGDQLPPAAQKYRAWWANERGRHVQASSWLGVGWKVGSVDLKAETVEFIRSAT